MRLTVTAASALTATAILAGCADNDAAVDPAIASVIASLENNPDIPRSWSEFTRVATREGLIETPEDVSRVGEAFAGVCMDYAITDVLGTARTGSDEIRAALREQNGLPITAEQFERIMPALLEMCEDMKEPHVQ